jgi:deoxycytidylate deaminase
MGCALVSGVDHGGGAALSASSCGAVELCTINTSLFGAHRSDCHAEANAVAECARRGTCVSGMTCYVTRAPCLACYKLLASAGVGRIVAPQPLDSPDCVASAAALGIECVALRDTDERAARRLKLGQSNEDMARVRALREERKRLRKEGSFGKKALRLNSAGRASPAGTQSTQTHPDALAHPQSEGQGSTREAGSRAGDSVVAPGPGMAPAPGSDGGAGGGASVPSHLC